MKNHFLIRFIFLFSLLFPGGVTHLRSQDVVVAIAPADAIPGDVKLPGPLPMRDSLEAMEKVLSFKKQVIGQGYLTAGVDSVFLKNDTLHAIMTFGKQYRWAFLDIGNVPEDYIGNTRHREKMFTSQAFQPAEYSKMVQRILRSAENNGYPFATLKLDSIKLEGQELSGTLIIERNELVVIDSLIIKGGVKTSRKYLQNHLGVQSGIPFNQAALNKIPTRLKELPFIKVIKPYEVGMRPGKADIYLYLDDKKASNFNGIIGIMPETQTGKTLLTGDVELNLLNSFNRGESINLKWQRLQTRTQELNLAFAYPFVFNSPFGIETGLDLYRRDTIFSTLKSVIGAQYFFKGGKYARLFYENNQSNVISSESFSIDEFIDSRIHLFGIGLNFQDLDYKFNPSSGYFLEASVSAGKKKILQNPKVDISEYQDMNSSSDIYNMVFRTGIYIPFAKRSVVLGRLRGAYLLNDNMFKNEIFRIGGIKTMRGFNEQSIYASGYGVGTVEYRFLLEENSNIFVFYDYGMFEDRSGKDYIEDRLMGIGAGINFETNAGVFSLTYALGKQGSRSFEIRNAKIHFGFISFF